MAMGGVTGRTWVAWAGVWIALSGACGPVEPPPPSPPGAPTPCDGAPEHYGCPGMPCAHGACFVGVCEGTLHDDAGELVDAGVCCEDDECLTP